jgi:hypothetical protein
MKKVAIVTGAATRGIVGLTKTLALELGPFGITRERDRAGLHQDAAHRAGRLGTREPAVHRRAAGSQSRRARRHPYVSGATLDGNCGWYFGP